MEIQINYFAILIASIIAMVVGFLWYSPILFGKPWAKLKGFTEASLKAEQQKMGKLYGLSFLATLLSVYVLSHVMFLSGYFYKYSQMQIATTSAFFMWLGFVMPVQITAQIFGEKKWKLFAIDTGYQLAALISAGLVLALF